MSLVIIGQHTSSSEAAEMRLGPLPPGPTLLWLWVAVSTAVLLHVPPFYIYDDPVISLSGIATRCDLSGAPTAERETADAELMALLARHPARTPTPQNATVFVVPTPVLVSYFCDDQHKRSHIARLDAAFNTLCATRWWKRRNGADHLLGAHGWLCGRGMG